MILVVGKERGWLRAQVRLAPRPGLVFSWAGALGTLKEMETLQVTEATPSCFVCFSFSISVHLTHFSSDCHLHLSGLCSGPAVRPRGADHNQALPLAPERYTFAMFVGQAHSTGRPWRPSQKLHNCAWVSNLRRLQDLTSAPSALQQGHASSFSFLQLLLPASCLHN